MATRTALVARSEALWRSPVLVDGPARVRGRDGRRRWLCSQARSTISLGPWPAYLFALGFGLILLFRRRQPVLALLVTSLGICVYLHTGLPSHRPRPADRRRAFSVAEAGHLRIGIVVSVILVGLAVYFQIIAGRNVGLAARL
jgi:hypothetical protein